MRGRQVQCWVSRLMSKHHDRSRICFGIKYHWLLKENDQRNNFRQKREKRKEPVAQCSPLIPILPPSILIWLVSSCPSLPAWAFPFWHESFGRTTSFVEVCVAAPIECVVYVCSRRKLKGTLRSVFLCSAVCSICRKLEDHKSFREDCEIVLLATVDFLVALLGQAVIGYSVFCSRW